MKKNVFLIGAPKSGTTSLVKFFENNQFKIHQNPLFVNPQYIKKYEKNRLIKDLYKDDFTLISNPNCFSKKKYIDNLHNFITNNGIQNYIIVLLLRHPHEAFKSLIKYRLKTTTISEAKEDIEKLQSDNFNMYQYYEKLKHLYELFDDARIKVIFSNDLFDKTKTESILAEFKNYFPDINNLKLPSINRNINKKPIIFKSLFRAFKKLLIFTKLYMLLTLLPVKYKFFLRKIFYQFTPKTNRLYEINYSSHYLEKLDNDFRQTKEFMKRRKITDKIIIDLDKTLCDSLNKNYPEAKPNLKIIEKIHKYKDKYRIIIFTSRNMKTYQSDIELIKKNTLPIIIRWLKAHNVYYDEIIIGKPWCGEKGFYVDDKSVRPDEFQNLSLPEINRLINK